MGLERGLAVAAIVSEIFLIGCTGKDRPKSVDAATPVGPESTPLVIKGDMARGQRLRSNFTRTVYEFVSPHYTKPGFDLPDRFADERNQGASITDMVVTRTPARQHFLISNKYNQAGRVIEEGVSTSMVGKPIGNIHKVAFPNPDLINDNRTIDPSNLEQVARLLVNLPTGIQWTEGRVCFQYPTSWRVGIAEARFGIGKTGDGRIVDAQIHSAGNMSIVISESSQRNPNFRWGNNCSTPQLEQKFRQLVQLSSIRFMLGRDIY